MNCNRILGNNIFQSEQWYNGNITMWEKNAHQKHLTETKEWRDRLAMSVRGGRAREKHPSRIENDLCDHGMFYLVAQQLTLNNKNTYELNPWHRFERTPYANCATHLWRSIRSVHTPHSRKRFNPFSCSCSHSDDCCMFGKSFMSHVTRV